MTSARCLSLLLASAALAACAAFEPPLPGGYTTYAELRHYYRRHAVEWDGRCRAPYLDGVLASEVVEDTPEQMVLRVKYHYRDEVGWENGGSPIHAFGGTDRCKGIEERTFTLAKRPDDQVQVVEMSGLARGEPMPALFH